MTVKRRNVKRRALALTVAMAVGLGGPLALWAQDMGGISLTYGVDSRIAGHDNLDLDTTDERSSVVWDTRLSFGFRTTTQVSWLGLDAGALLRQKLGGDATVENGLINPNIGLTFGRAGVNARIEGGLSLSETDLANNETLDEFDTPAGSRRDRSANLQLTWGLDSRVSWRLGATVRNSEFDDSPGSLDRRTLTYTAGATLALSEAMSLDLGLSRNDFREDGEDSEITNALNAGLTIARMNGTFSFGLSASDTPSGDRTGLTVGRSLELPDGTLSAQIGATRLISGDMALTGALDYSRDMPRGRLTASLSRDVSSSSEDDSEVEVTRASVGLSQDLTDRARISADLGLAQQSYTDDSQPDIRNIRAGVSFSYELGQDWLATAGLSHVQRRRDGGDATDNSVYIGVRRSWERSY